MDIIVETYSKYAKLLTEQCNFSDFSCSVMIADFWKQRDILTLTPSCWKQGSSSIDQNFIGYDAKEFHYNFIKFEQYFNTTRIPSSQIWLAIMFGFISTEGSKNA